MQLMRSRTREATPQSDPLAEHRAYVDRIPSDEWFAMARWSKERGKLESWQRALAYDIGRYKKEGWTLSNKQYLQAARAHVQAVAEGFEAPWN